MLRSLFRDLAGTRNTYVELQAIFSGLETASNPKESENGHPSESSSDAKVSCLVKTKGFGELTKTSIKSIRKCIILFKFRRMQLLKTFVHSFVPSILRVFVCSVRSVRSDCSSVHLFVDWFVKRFEILCKVTASAKAVMVFCR